MRWKLTYWSLLHTLFLFILWLILHFLPTSLITQCLSRRMNITRLIIFFPWELCRWWLCWWDLWLLLLKFWLLRNRKTLSWQLIKLFLTWLEITKRRKFVWWRVELAGMILFWHPKYLIIIVNLLIFHNYYYRICFSSV